MTSAGARGGGVDRRRYARWLRVCGCYARWLRVRSAGLEHVPATGPVLLVGNHAGLRSLDHLLLQSLVGGAAGRPVRGLAHRSVEDHRLVASVHVDHAGAVVGSREAAGALLDAGEVVAVYPEGGRTTDKRFADRDRVLPRPSWSDGWVRIAVEHGAVVVPFGVSGVESAVPTLARSGWLGRRWGLDGAYPVAPQTLPTLTVPWLAFLLPLPVRCAVVMGAAVDLTVPLGRTPADRQDRAVVSEVVRGRVQRLVDEARLLRGRRPR